MQTGQTDLRIKSAKLNFYSKHGKKMKSAANYAKNVGDEKSGLHTGVRTSGNIGADKAQRADDYEPNSILKSEETNILENIAVNFEILNNSLSKSLTPCLSNRNPNVRMQQRTVEGQKNLGVLSRTVGLATPHGAYDRDGFGDHAEL